MIIKEQNDIKEYIRVFWKRRWLITIPTFVCMGITAAVSFLLPPKWEVDCIIRPSKFLIETTGGAYQEVKANDPDQIAELVNQEVFTAAIADFLEVDLNRFPDLTAKHLVNTDLIRISVKVADVDMGRRILQKTFELLRTDLDRKIGVEIKGLENLIANNENTIKGHELSIIDRENEILNIRNDIKLMTMDIRIKQSQKTSREQEIRSIENLLIISDERVKTILEETKSVKQRIQRIEEQQNKVLSEQEKNSLSLLLYSNEIQENLRYYNTLDKEFSNERTKQEDLKLRIQRKTEEIKLIDIEIDMARTRIESTKIQVEQKKNSIQKIQNDIGKTQNRIVLLNDRKDRIDPSQLIKEPTSSLFPVSPKKRLNVIIAAVLGLSLFTLVAFFLEYTQGHVEDKDKS